MIKHESPTAVIKRYKQIFLNVVVMNYNDKSKDLLERFYCDAIPNSSNACKRAIEMTKTKGEAKKSKLQRCIRRVDVCCSQERYDQCGPQQGILWSSTDCHQVPTAIKAHKEKTLKLSSDDFPRACPSSKVFGKIWDLTLRSEKEINKHVKNGLNCKGEGR